MAKKQKRQKKKAAPRKKIKLNKNRIFLVMGFSVLGLAIILFISQLSYLATWKVDQSELWDYSWQNREIAFQNQGGKFGFFLANLTINRWFGLASLIIPFLLLLIGLRFFYFKILPLRKTFFYSIIVMLILSVWLSLISVNTKPIFGGGYGGMHGYYIASYLISLLGWAGTLIFLVILNTIILLTLSNKLLQQFYEFIGSINGKPELFKQKKPDDTVKDEDIAEKEIKDKTEQGEESKGEAVFETNFPTNHADESLDYKIETIEKEEDFEVVSKQEEETITIEEKEPEKDIELTVENKDYKEEVVDSSYEAPLEDYDPTLDLSHYKVPPLELLEQHDTKNTSVTESELFSNKKRIEETLNQFKINITKIVATIGPTVTLYEIVPAPGIRISKIKNLEDDIALSLSALGIRIIAPIPGKGTIGIEVPNQHPEVVSMRSLLTSKRYQESKYELPVALGKTISNETLVFDLVKMPHLLVAGATGQGKSVGLNVILTSLLYRKHPSQLKFVLVDPKKVELTLFQRIEKHFLAKIPDAEESIVTDTQKVIYTLNSLCIEMDQRYDLLKKAEVRNIKEYNAKFIKRKLNPENGHKFMPYIVVVIDEFADLIMTAGREVETPLARLAQLARAIGIHLVIATQRPTTNIITGMIKANFPARIAFRVTSMIDSRTILDGPGANQLIGRGDLLFAPGSEITRLQCAFVDIPELENITKHISKQQSYPTAFYLPEYAGEDSDSILDVDLSKKDALFNDAARLVVAHQQGSTSLIQRKFSIGYNRAGRIMDQLEAAEIVGPFEGSKARQVLIPDEYTLEQFLKDME